MVKEKAATLRSRGAQIDTLNAIREEMRALNKQVDALAAEKKELEEQIIEEMLKEGITQASSGVGTVTISEQEVASVEDWDKFNAWVKRNNAFYLYQRRVNNAPYRELLASRKNRLIPGVKTVKVVSLSLRKKA